MVTWVPFIPLTIFTAVALIGRLAKLKSWTQLRQQFLVIALLATCVIFSMVSTVFGPLRWAKMLFSWQNTPGMRVLNVIDVVTFNLSYVAFQSVVMFQILVWCKASAVMDLLWARATRRQRKDKTKTAQE